MPVVSAYLLEVDALGKDISLLNYLIKKEHLNRNNCVLNALYGAPSYFDNLDSRPARLLERLQLSDYYYNTVF